MDADDEQVMKITADNIDKQILDEQLLMDKRVIISNLNPSI